MNNKIDQIKAKILANQYVLNGTVAERYKQCGKENCCCREGKEKWHGPYWIWTRKENGKTITKTLSKKQAVFVLSAIKNMKKLKGDIEGWRSLSLKEIENI